MGASKSIKVRTELLLEPEDDIIINKLYSNLSLRDLETCKVGYNALSDLTNFPALWTDKIISMYDKDMSMVIPEDKFFHFINSVSFLDSTLLLSFIYKICDVDSDGLIDSKDLTCFLKNLPRELALVVEDGQTTTTEMIEPQCIIKIKFEKDVHDKSIIVHNRGINYETLFNQMYLLADAIIQHFDNGNAGSMDYGCFLSWIKENSDLVSYIFNKLCPMQWLSKKTTKKALIQKEEKKFKMDTAIRLNSQENLSKKTSPTIKVEQMLTKAAFGTTIPPKYLAQTSDKKGCTLCCSPGISKAYLFQKNSTKEGFLSTYDGEELTRVFVICKYKFLYIFSSSKTTIIDVIPLTGCYVKDVPNIEISRVNYSGFSVVIGEHSQRKEIDIFHNEKAVAIEWKKNTEGDHNRRKILRE